MLLTEWVSFKEEKTAATAETTSRIITNGNNTGAEVPLVDPATNELTVAEQSLDIDDIPIAMDMSSPVTAAVAEKTPDSSRIVEVHTDVLQVAIDLRGGDIVETALTAYLEKLDSPNVPLVLLEQNEQRIYISQSGLIGPNGIDKANRPLFSSASSRQVMADGQDTLEVDLSWKDDTGVSIIKRFTLTRGEYLVKVEYLVDNGSNERWQANMFGQIKRDSSEDPSTSSGQGLTPFFRCCNDPARWTDSLNSALMTWLKSLSRHRYPLVGSQ